MLILSRALGACPTLVTVPDPLTRSYNEKLEKRGEEEGLVKVGTEYHHGMLHAVAGYE